MRIHKRNIPGLIELRPKVYRDERGSFVKTFNEREFQEAGLDTKFVEEYFSRSKAGVIRGLHFQVPPHDHAKMVFCLWGRVLDAVVDLRIGSPTYGGFVTLELGEASANGLYIPRGLAHGFCVLSPEAVLMYATTTLHAPGFDKGIRWDSAGIPWPAADPVLSARDRSLPPLEDFQSPFLFRND